MRETALLVGGVLCLVVAGVAGGTADTFLALGVLCLFALHIGWVNEAARSAREASGSVTGLSRVTAKWLGTLGRRTGQLDGRAWVCGYCLQANTPWEDACGRCEHERDDDVGIRVVP